jgi:hypothetical protein
LIPQKKKQWFLVEGNNMKYFGTAWNPNIASLEQVPAPVGSPCVWCEEPIKEGEDGLTIPHIAEDVTDRPYHQECFLRTVVGSLAHQQQRCSCFGGVDEEDSPSVSKRVAAQQAVEFFQKGLRK